MTSSWNRCNKEAVGNTGYCKDHLKLVTGALQTKNPAEALRAAEKSAQQSRLERVKSGTQNIVQTIRYSMPVSASKILGLIIAIAIGAVILNYLLGTVMIGDQTAWQWLVAKITPIIEQILFLSPTLLYFLIIGTPTIIFLIIVRYGNIAQNFYNLLLVLFVAVWLPDLLLAGYWAANSYTLGQAQIQCVFATGDVNKCTANKEPVANAEAGVLESPFTIKFGIYDIGTKTVTPPDSATAGQEYSLGMVLEPKTDYDPKVEGVVINVIGKNDRGETINFAGDYCTSLSPCTTNKDFPITDTLYSAGPIPCGSKFLTLYSQVNYYIEGAREGYHVRIIRSQEYQSMSLQDDIGKASKIYGPVNLYLGFSSQHVVIPKTGTGKVTVYIFAENKINGVASLKNLRVVQQPEKSDVNKYKLNLVSCSPVMPTSISQDDNGDVHYIFDREVEINPTAVQESPWQWGGSQTTTEVEKSKITCTFEIPFTLDESDYYKTMTFNIYGSYTYSEQKSTESVQVWGACD